MNPFNEIVVLGDVAEVTMAGQTAALTDPFFTTGTPGDSWDGM